MAENRTAAAARRAGARRSAILDTLREASTGMGVQSLAEASGLHENTVRFHLRRLLEDGLVVREAGTASGRGRPRQTYTARRERAPRDNYELMAQILASYLAGTVEDPGAAALEAGEAWGRYRAHRPAPFRQTGREAAVEDLVEMLDGIGFEPTRTEEPEGTEIHLHHCPFLTVARDNQQVACSLHLGLMRGTLAELRTTVTTESLTPWVRPGLCVARLRDRPAST